MREKEPNTFGLYDMHGNIWEWVEDDGHGDYENAPVDGSAWVDAPWSPFRVLRGGAWDDDARYCRAAKRHSFILGGRNVRAGFRFAGPPAQVSQAGARNA